LGLGVKSRDGLLEPPNSSAQVFEARPEGEHDFLTLNPPHEKCVEYPIGFPVKSQRGRIHLMMSFVLQMQSMTDMAPWFMGGLSALGLIIFLLLLLLSVLLAVVLFGIRARLNAIISGMNILSGDLRRLAKQLDTSRTQEGNSGSGEPES